MGPDKPVKPHKQNKAGRNPQDAIPPADRHPQGLAHPRRHRQERHTNTAAALPHTGRDYHRPLSALGLT